MQQVCDMTSTFRKLGEIDRQHIGNSPFHLASSFFPPAAHAYQAIETLVIRSLSPYAKLMYLDWHAMVGKKYYMGARSMPLTV
jgi:hypothetical protein